MILSEDHDLLKARLAEALKKHGWVANTGPGIAIATKSFATAVGEKQAVAYLNPSSEGVGRLDGNYVSEGNNVLSAMRAGWTPIQGDASNEELTQKAADYDAEVLAIVGGTYAMRLACNWIEQLPLINHPYADFSLLDAVNLAVSHRKLCQQPAPTSLKEARETIQEMWASASHLWTTGMAALDVLDAACDGRNLRESCRLC